MTKESTIQRNVVRLAWIGSGWCSGGIVVADRSSSRGVVTPS
jgi:hypothetical protein